MFASCKLIIENGQTFLPERICDNKVKEGFGSMAPRFVKKENESMEIFDSLLIYAYGGPESMEETAEFLANVAQGKRISLERLEEVLAHYRYFNGKSPMNGAIRKFMTRWRETVPEIPIYFGCRYATAPSLKETVRQMILDGRKRSLVFIPAPFNGYRETYFERFAEVRKELEAEIAFGASSEYGVESETALRSPRFPAGSIMPEFEFFPAFSGNPHFLQAQENVVAAALDCLPEASRRSAVLLFSVHSLPLSVARRSGYDSEARETVEFLRKRFPENQTELVWQSASVSRVPWLEPDILHSLQKIGNEWTLRRELGGGNVRGICEFHGENERRPVLLIPLGFPFANMEVAYDLGVEASCLAKEYGLLPIPAPTIENETEFLTMILENF